MSAESEFIEVFLVYDSCDSSVELLLALSWLVFIWSRRFFIMTRCHAHFISAFLFSVSYFASALQKIMSRTRLFFVPP